MNDTNNNLRMARQRQIYNRHRASLLDVRRLENIPDILPNMFIHVPKTAGLSIKGTALVNTPFPCAVHHATYKSMEAIAGLDFMSRMFKFACVRDPYTRFVSAFAFCRTPQVLHNFKGSNLHKDVNKYVNDELDAETLGSNLFMRPQWHFLKNAEDDVTLDYLMRFESMEEDWAVVSDVLSGNPVPLRRHHHKKQSAQEHILTKKSKNKIYKLYKEDFELFEYKK